LWKTGIHERDAPELYRLIERFNVEIDTIIVEGIRDEDALRRIGYEGCILRLSRTRGVLGLSLVIRKEHRHEKILILTDFDRRGEELYRKIKNELESVNVKIDEKLRIELKKILEKYSLKTIESIKSLL